jgi:hypothetical protein
MLNLSVPSPLIIITDTTDPVSHKCSQCHQITSFPFTLIRTLLQVFLLEKPEGKRPLRRPRRRREDNIKMDLLEMGFAGMDWNDLAEDRDRWRAIVNAVMNFLVP